MELKELAFKYREFVNRNHVLEQEFIECNTSRELDKLKQRPQYENTFENMLNWISDGEPN